MTQARYWAITTATRHADDDGTIIRWEPSADLIKGPITYVKGQREIGGQQQYDHWQWFVYCKNRIRFQTLKELLPNWSHIEKSNSAAYEDYVWKDDTAVPGSRFEFGERKETCKKDDWDAIKLDAMNGNFDNIPSNVLVRHYASITRLRKDYLTPQLRPTCEVNVFWGVTGSGKTYRAFQEATAANGGFYRKASTTKWWDGYNGEANILIDEFDGKSIGIAHLLQWLDVYPMSVENKGGCLPLGGTRFWITSNINPVDWFPDATPEHRAALRRRLTKIHHFANSYEDIKRLEELLLVNIN